MRLVSAFLFVALTGTWAFADEVKPADPKPEVTKERVPFRVVKMLPETGQVLLFDRDRGNHVVAEVGQTLDGYRVDDLDDESVTLVAGTGTRIILAAPPARHPRRAHAKAHPADPYAGEPADDADSTAAASDHADSVATASDHANSTAAVEGAAVPGAPIDPYAEPAPPLTPGEGGVRVASAAAPTLATSAPLPPAGVPASPTSASPTSATPTSTPATSASPTSAPSTSGSSAIRSVAQPAPTPAPPPPDLAASEGPADDTGSALAAALTGGPAAATTSAPSTATTSAPSATGTSTASTAATSTASAAGTSATLARAELDAALADFGRLASSFRATFIPNGLRLDAVRDGSLLTRIGLRKGDIITSVDGQPLRSLDDAASLYARASSLRATTIQLTRAGEPVTLRVAIR